MSGVKDAAHRLYYTKQEDTQAVIKQKLHCGSSTMLDAIWYFEDHNAIHLEGQRRRPSKLTNSILITSVEMKALQNGRFAIHKIREFEN